MFCYYVVFCYKNKLATLIVLAQNLVRAQSQISAHLE